MMKYASEEEEELRTGRLYPEPTAPSQHYFRGGTTFMEEDEPGQEDDMQATTASLHEIRSLITDMNHKLTSIHETLHSNPPSSSHSFRSPPSFPSSAPPSDHSPASTTFLHLLTKVWPLLLFLGCLCFVVAFTIGHHKNLYHELGVEPTASQAELKRAFRQWALKNHPDKFPKAEQAEQSAYFSTMSAAFEVLMEEETRKSYDLSFAFQPLKTVLELLQSPSSSTSSKSWDEYGLLLCLSLMLGLLIKFHLWSTFLLYRWLHRLGGGWFPGGLVWLLAAALPLYRVSAGSALVFLLTSLVVRAFLVRLCWPSSAKRNHNKDVLKRKKNQ
ncbi:DnaJ-like protein xdj1 [Balamuthia mandrillaris]